MANTFKKASAEAIGTTETTVYTVPTATTAVIIGFTIANTTTGLVYVDITVGATRLGKAIPIPSGSSLGALDGKLVMEAGDILKVTSSEPSSLDVLLSIMEVT